jgi:hypothetical protein
MYGAAIFTAFVLIGSTFPGKKVPPAGSLVITKGLGMQKTPSQQGLITSGTKILYEPPNLQAWVYYGAEYTIAFCDKIFLPQTIWTSLKAYLPDNKTHAIYNRNAR